MRSFLLEVEMHNLPTLAKRGKTGGEFACLDDCGYGRQNETDSDRDWLNLGNSARKTLIVSGAYSNAIARWTI